MFAFHVLAQIGSSPPHTPIKLVFPNFPVLAWICLQSGLKRLLHHAVEKQIVYVNKVTGCCSGPASHVIAFSGHLLTYVA